MEGLLEISGVQVMGEGVRAGTHLAGWSERMPDCKSCNAETMGIKCCCCLLYVRVQLAACVVFEHRIYLRLIYDRCLISVRNC